MTLIEGIGDEVTHFFIGLLVVVVVSLAWWTTSISEQRHVQTVWLLDRRRHRAHRRLTNHTHAVTIAEGLSRNPSEFDLTSIICQEQLPQAIDETTEASTATYTSDPTIMEHNYAEAANAENQDNQNKESRDSSDIRIKLKYINDDLKLVDGKLQEQLGDFKK
ncbi:transmembrane and ubiquitin-like domain-containing protein 1 [Asbolus verrucosus]|uniref:Transmembrane and ubiquitin-like domain-containing protein 1 n=1 Tax=Asbolus verrucosus TaxID=1661398 RepID=A0A482VQN8_ASBVE|nr:transmembrane and ubiquitin-like domain-containing protein 1 [Asbolus verrucosus]